MNKNLYFICPTDHLENIIESSLTQENCYISSLGNSLKLDSDTLGQINGIIDSYNIKEVTFVLADDNQFFTKMGQLEINEMATHLNAKVKELRPKIYDWLTFNLSIKTLIYYRNKNVFIEAHSNLVKVKEHCLN